MTNDMGNYMQKPYVDHLNQYISACLQAYEGNSADLKCCLEQLLGLKQHHHLETFKYSQLKPLVLLLEDPTEVMSMIPESDSLSEAELTESKKWIRERLVEIHTSTVQQQYLASNLGPRHELAYSLMRALNQRQSPVSNSSDENYAPESTTENCL